MQYLSSYDSPLGGITLASDGEALTGLWFVGQKYCGLYLEAERRTQELPLFAAAKNWLDVYFSGEEPAFEVPLRLEGTGFQKEVWAVLRKIPYGKTTTYGEIAAALAKNRGLERMSARAVGGAIGRNRISIIVPCHRVVGADGSLTGYAGGIARKMELLKLEGGFGAVAPSLC